ncbi:uncharacterized protein Z520_12377 [Fonsecaea multimorphosa CBS 102226]|uniref:Phytanoyl-CoA dioxygenase n=1 Tax=Fonsecaea multimorphosa CBS 102226 TaxID=1442371 RepID=A0A0D2JN78_9EURO|nr:uncharacterized protein Z520_12377 [Fonsecaea multimorphosa CBS 102226]KIX91914.1 hypothetical protein Z520_12377 [Fonsecaea multimorphosa CBS 102226]OAL19185.1 hypothetical protein AYO22_09946 [Fonsecaea multimorphosa]
MDSNSTTSSACLANGHSAGAGAGGSNGVGNGPSSSSSSHAQTQVPKRLYSVSAPPPSLAAFRALCTQSTSRETYPHASAVVSNIPIYDLPEYPDLPAAADGGFVMDELQDEWHHILLSGPGVVVLRNFSPDRELLERVNAVFADIIAGEAARGGAGQGQGQGGDHFAARGSNARIWNSFQKHAERDPVSFARYYANPYLAAMCAAWLGPGYQITAQVNVVRPGGKPQVPHRDYHLGFQSAESCALYPAATQVATQFLTLQGAIAHSDMPRASGPTRLLPFSQQFAPGYMAYRLAEFQAFFAQNWVTVDLAMGDALFFNPALFHAAGENTTRHIHRSANLLQVSSAFGRTMETVDTLAVIASCWDEVTRLYVDDGAGAAAGGDKTQLQTGTRVDAILNAIGNGYPFPTNLDRRPPAPGGMAPENEVDVLRKALLEGWDVERVVRAITAIRRDSMAQIRRPKEQSK